MATTFDDESLVDELTRAPQRAMIARAFVELELPEHLRGGPMPIAALARFTAADESSLERLLRAAVAVGLCEVRPDGAFGLTGAGLLLTADAAGSAAGWLVLMTQPWMTRAWEQLADAVRTGNSPFSEVNGSGFWEYVAEHPADAAMFHAAMTSGAEGRAEDLNAAVDLHTVGTVVDVGGGEGLLAAELVRRHGHLRAVVADRAEVISSPDRSVLAHGERIALVPTDFFGAVPADGDMYVLSRILHDWPDTEALAILKQCRSAMEDDSVLVLLEQLAPEAEDSLDPTERMDALIKDLNMLVLVGGRERSLAAYSSLLQQAGFTVERHHQGQPCDVVVARAVPRGDRP